MDSWTTKILNGFHNINHYPALTPPLRHEGVPQNTNSNLQSTRALGGRVAVHVVSEVVVEVSGQSAERARGSEQEEGLETGESKGQRGSGGRRREGRSDNGGKEGHAPGGGEGRRNVKAVPVFVSVCADVRVEFANAPSVSRGSGEGKATGTDGREKTQKRSGAVQRGCVRSISAPKLRTLRPSSSHYSPRSVLSLASTVAIRGGRARTLKPAHRSLPPLPVQRKYDASRLSSVNSCSTATAAEILRFPADGEDRIKKRVLTAHMSQQGGAEGEVHHWRLVFRGGGTQSPETGWDPSGKDCSPRFAAQRDESMPTTHSRCQRDVTSLSPVRSQAPESQTQSQTDTPMHGCTPTHPLPLPPPFHRPPLSPLRPSRHFPRS
ncbi:hypothetical protein H6P81_007587 [Aristolochia fimbriata]|uniref:Uncharacterized protein n=1 Tax=Aristolochia fimbriata TaxID=158543 RepID=A0AAV7F566_ARIFI|nr:hypothetical protein H6P81_007587 [Aristolochia fimbriata]